MVNQMKINIFISCIQGIRKFALVVGKRSFLTHSNLFFFLKKKNFYT